MIHLHKNIIIRMKRDIIKSRVEFSLHFMNKAEFSDFWQKSQEIDKLIRNRKNK